ncbi:hypothetical protein MUG78_15490 [Gordonia alkaliphila]|uniref:hypothetical protein n=1 Tax=Gordonia alkaliphila TaxID=1053547 RepID=UPI001FF1809B|nr:hypothetical protein [Gordonia alkaliphila]MCK0440815.1 hypothetical protein [Gordonia alkaliphila]
MAHYVDPIDGTEYPIDAPRWRSDAGRPLWIAPGGGLGRDDIDASTASLWRYRAALPVEFGHPITLGEGRTPLLERAWGALLSVARCSNSTSSIPPAASRTGERR